MVLSLQWCSIKLFVHWEKMTAYLWVSFQLLPTLRPRGQCRTWAGLSGSAFPVLSLLSWPRWMQLGLRTLVHYPALHHCHDFAHQEIMKKTSIIGWRLVSPPFVAGWVLEPSDMAFPRQRKAKVPGLFREQSEEHIVLFISPSISTGLSSSHRIGSRAPMIWGLEGSFKIF